MGEKHFLIELELLYYRPEENCSYSTLAQRMIHETFDQPMKADLSLGLSGGCSVPTIVGH